MVKDILEFQKELWNKRYNKMLIQKIVNMIEEHKDNLELLKTINDFTSQCIEEHKKLEEEQKK